MAPKAAPHTERERSPRRRGGDLVVNARWLRDFSGPDALSPQQIGDLITGALQAMQRGEAQGFSVVVRPVGDRPTLRFFLAQVGLISMWRFSAEELD